MCQRERNIVLTSTDFIICEMFIVLEDDFVEIRFKAIITWTWRIKIKTLDYLQTNKILTLFDGRRLYFRIFDGWQLLVKILLTSFKFQCIFIARDDSLPNSMINITVVLKNWFTFYYFFIILTQIQYKWYSCLSRQPPGSSSFLKYIHFLFSFLCFGFFNSYLFLSGKYKSFYCYCYLLVPVVLQFTVRSLWCTALVHYCILILSLRVKSREGLPSLPSLRREISVDSDLSSLLISQSASR